MSTQRIPFQYVLDPAALTASSGVGVAGAIAVATKQIQSDSWFILEKLIANSVGVFQAQMFDWNGGAMSNLPVQNANIFGTAQFPYMLPDPLIMPPGVKVNFNLQDLTGAGGNIVEIILEGYRDFDTTHYPYDVHLRHPFSIEQWDAKFFQYVSNVTIPASAGQTDAVVMNFGGTFIHRQVMALSNVGAAAGAFKIQLTKGGANRSTSDAQTNNVNGVGTAQLPKWYRSPLVLEANSIMSLAFTDTSAAQNVVQTVLGGTRLFPQSHPKVIVAPTGIPGQFA